jgi:hypothetical protein
VASASSACCSTSASSPKEDLQPLLARYLGVPRSRARSSRPRRADRQALAQVPAAREGHAAHAVERNARRRDGRPRRLLRDPGPAGRDRLTIEPRLGAERDIAEALEQAYGGGAGGDANGGDGGDAEVAFVGEDEEDVNHLRDLASEAPVIRLVNMLINRAVESRASDIHIEPFEDGAEGPLPHRRRAARRRDAAAPPPGRDRLAHQDHGEAQHRERRLPQDGRIKLRMMGKEIDLRVSTLPTLYGESVVLRILDRSSISVKLETLGFPEDTLKEFEQIIERPYGMILVTGPTGSGKTTTLYGALDKINSPDKKIITIEDPVEYQLFGVNQIHVKPAIGLTFAAGLRSIVRQDPDVIMVGEIRDAETAEIAIQSALTGHLVFSTLHTNDAAGAIAASSRWASRAISSRRRSSACSRSGSCAASAPSAWSRPRCRRSSGARSAAARAIPCAPSSAAGARSARARATAAEPASTSSCR